MMQEEARQIPLPFVGEIDLKAKPFLKWAGGKTQLLEQIAAHLPPALLNGAITRYVEPFIGGGAVFFYIAQTCGVKQLFISDRNEELILTYRTIQQAVEQVVAILSEIEGEYFQLGQGEQRAYFYDVRQQFNARRSQTDYGQINADAALRAAQLIFLNRTCFNGLFRVNSKGEFNVPFGRYKNPRLCDEANLRAVSAVLQTTEIRSGDFTAFEEVIDRDTFVYFDPPYRPISRTASFNAYARQAFDDASQERLAQFYRQLDGGGASLMLSNADPQNENPADDFFERLYRGFRINKVMAKRAINSNGEKRGAITELLITNYEDVNSVQSWSEE